MAWRDLSPKDRIDYMLAHKTANPNLSYRDVVNKYNEIGDDIVYPKDEEWNSPIGSKYKMSPYPINLERGLDTLDDLKFYSDENKINSEGYSRDEYFDKYPTEQEYLSDKIHKGTKQGVSFNKGLQEFGDGGTLPKPYDRIYTDEAKFNKANQMYNDSLVLNKTGIEGNILHDKYKPNNNNSNLVGATGNQKLPQSEVDRIYNDDFYKSYGRLTKNNKGTYPMSTNFHVVGDVFTDKGNDYYGPQYKKPIEHPVLQKPIIKQEQPIPSVKEIVKQPVIPVKPKEEIRTTPQYGYQPHPNWSNQQGNTTYFIDNPNGTRYFPTPQQWQNDTIGKPNQVKKYKWGGDTKPKYSMSYDNQYNQQSDNTVQPQFQDPYLKGKLIEQSNKLQQEEKDRLALEYYNKRKNQSMIGIKGTPDEIDRINKDVSNYSANNEINNKYRPIEDKLSDLAFDVGTSILPELPLMKIAKRIPGIAELSKGKDILKEEQLGKTIYDKVIYPNKETKLSRDLEPYLSKKILPESNEDKIFNSFLTPEAQAKKLKERTINYNQNGEVVKNGFNPDILTNTLWHGYLPKILPDELPKSGYFRKIGDEKGLRDLINSGEARMPPGENNFTGTPGVYFSKGAPIEDYPGRFVIHHPGEGEIKTYFDGIQDKKFMTPNDKIYPRSVTPVRLDDPNMTIYKRGFWNTNYKKIDKDKLEEAMKNISKYKNYEEALKVATRYGLRTYLTKEVYDKYNNWSDERDDKQSNKNTFGYK